MRDLRSIAISLTYPSLNDRLRYRLYRRRYEVDHTFRFNGDNVVLGGEGRIILGADSYIGAGSSISTTARNFVKIGEDCRVSQRVAFYTSTYRVKPYLMGDDVYRYGDIELGKRCWVGAGSYIGPSVTLPPRSIVPANSVVTRSLKSPDELIPKHG